GESEPRRRARPPPPSAGKARPARPSCTPPPPPPPAPPPRAPCPPPCASSHSSRKVGQYRLALVSHWGTNTGSPLRLRRSLEDLVGAARGRGRRDSRRVGGRSAPAHHQGPPRGGAPLPGPGLPPDRPRGGVHEPAGPLGADGPDPGHGAQVRGPHAREPGAAPGHAGGRAGGPH